MICVNPFEEDEGLSAYSCRSSRPFEGIDRGDMTAEEGAYHGTEFEKARGRWIGEKSGNGPIGISRTSECLKLTT